MALSKNERKIIDDLFSQGLKNCSCDNCKEANPQPLSNFGRDKYEKYGYKSQCKNCAKLVRKPSKPRKTLPGETVICKDCNEEKPYYKGKRCKECVGIADGKTKGQTGICNGCQQEVVYHHGKRCFDCIREGARLTIGQIGICSSCDIECTYSKGNICRECLTKSAKESQERLSAQKVTCPYCNELKTPVNGTVCEDCKNKQNKEWREENKEYVTRKNKEYADAHVEEKAIYDAVYRVANKEKRDEYRKIYYVENYDTIAARSTERKARKRQATPKAMMKTHRKEALKIYKLARDLQQLSEEKLHVDHIVPLQGENVSGLHVFWNLQILSESENLKKSNSFDGTYDNNGWRKK
jgi:hypothetical protein